MSTPNPLAALQEATGTRFVAELPRGPSGKVQRLKLVDLSG